MNNNLQTFVKFLSQKANMEYVTSAPTKAIREQRKQELKFRFDKLNFADFSNAEVEDNGREQSIYTAAEMKQIREDKAMFEIRKTVTQADVEPDLKRFIERRNKQIKAARKDN